MAASNMNSVTEQADPEQGPICLPDSILQNINICTDSGNTDTLQSHMNDEEEIQDLASFLIHRACKNLTLANFFYWYLLLECEDQEPNLKQDVSCCVLPDIQLRYQKNYCIFK